MAVYYVSKDAFAGWLSGLEGRKVFAPSAKGGGAWLDARARDASGPPALEMARAAQSAKGFLLPAAEAVARYGAEASPVAVAEEEVVVVGVRACELRAWKYLDKVMLEGDFVEPFYQARRQGMRIISCDCVACAETCFCVLVGGRPFVEAGDGADINVTAMEGGYLVEPMTAAGEELLSVGGSQWSQAAPDQLDQRRRLREDMVQRLRRQNAEFTFAATDSDPPVLPLGDDESWQRHAADCVECGACTNICPTCHCFYLFDHKVTPTTAERVRTWDSCLLSTYHRMAGGPGMKLTPRPELRSRLANRILHKFVYSPQQYGVLGCVGCGRCVEACLGAIDIRKVVEDLKQ